MIKDLIAHDTICAIATPLGLGGIGIVRISGSRALEIVSAVFEPSHGAFPLSSHRLYHGWIKDYEAGKRIDEVLVSYMKAPRTYTREDIVEINCHSGYVVLEEVLHLVTKSGARLAAPGEFTYRAFLNGRIDLAQAEAVTDIVESKSPKALDFARQQLEGVLSSIVSGWIDTLIDIIAKLEAEVDFGEEIDTEENTIQTLKEYLQKKLVKPIQDLEERSRQCSLIREGVKLALLGKPNVGKSSIMNALLGKDRAIVTQFPGTTRDIIEDTFLLNGIPITIMDTAGIRKDAGYIEKLGIERTVASAREAHITLWILDLSLPLSDEDDEIFRVINNCDCQSCIVLNKADLSSYFDENDVKKRYGITQQIVTISAKRPDDIEGLKRFIAENFLRDAVEAASEAFVVNRDHLEYLRKAKDVLINAFTLMEEETYPELILIELYDAKKVLESIVGRGNLPEDILERVFSRFCIGK